MLYPKFFAFLFFSRLVSKPTESSKIHKSLFLFMIISGLCSSPDIILGEANISKSTYKVIFWSLGIEFAMLNSTELCRQVYHFSRKNTEQLPTTCLTVCRAWQKLQYGSVLNFYLKVFVEFAKVLFKYLVTKL